MVRDRVLLLPHTPQPHTRARVRVRVRVSLEFEYPYSPTARTPALEPVLELGLGLVRVRLLVRVPLLPESPHPRT